MKPSNEEYQRDVESYRNYRQYQELFRKAEAYENLKESRESFKLFSLIFVGAMFILCIPGIGTPFQIIIVKIVNGILSGLKLEFIATVLCSAEYNGDEWNYCFDMLKITFVIIIIRLIIIGIFNIRLKYGYKE